MSWTKYLAIALLVAIVLIAAFGGLFTSYGYASQSRDTIRATPSAQHLLGTDALGRDNLTRLVYGLRVSLVLAPAAALLSTLLAGLVGGIAGWLGGWTQRVVTSVMDLFLAMPWLLLLILARAMLPLNTSPATSVAITFAILGLLGWAAAARIVNAGVESIRESDFVLQARASGLSEWRLLVVHVLPSVGPVLLAQFWISVPVFILTEANLGLLGLGVAEPLPSLGSLLRELESMYGVLQSPWRLAPLALLVVMVLSFELILSNNEEIPA
jgi:peptide/nickel transport system permease protein